ncbi:outer membrane lipoprotein-sorting protein [Thalassolituus sp. UBA2009]|uniref:outer membrane lipoprotein-sorting protein n=1 Tax=Thalassolituus sp. UBA2009 TaxID=1947658 RepID=UPI00257D9FA7|nr:outer membrane lipoprotein-sorting protein [Thalassolituus sp. UBA2009]
MNTNREQHWLLPVINNAIQAGVNHPKTVLLAGLILMALLFAGLGKLYKDTRADAFLEADNPALVYKNKVREIFGLSDPLVVAVYDPSASGIYRAPTLDLIGQLTEQLNALPMINAARTISLASENNISASADGLDVAPFYELRAEGNTAALRQAIEDFPLYQGMLVSADGAMSMIVLELYDDSQAEAAYDAINQLLQQTRTPAGVELHVAGEGAVLGYLGHYIDHDASRLNPLAGLIITIMLVVAFRRLLPALLGNLVIAASVLMTLGFMAYCGVPFFVISNAMPVILIGMAVADSIHIFSHYYEMQARHPDWSLQACIREAVAVMARPVTLTSLTTIAGFLGLYASSYMPPFEYFGLFTAFGVLIAWFYSLFVLPACITLLKPKVSQRWIRLEQNSKQDTFARLMTAAGGICVRYPRTTLGIFALLSVSGAGLATQIQVNENRINTFHPSEAIYQADRIINQHLEGTNTLDIVITSSRNEGIFSPQVLNAMEALQAYAETLPHVNGSASVVDYLKQMNKSLNEGQSDAYRLPQDADLIAQYFLLYAASADPADFAEEIDYDYRIANIRLNLDSADFIATKPVIEALQLYIDQHFNNAAFAEPVSASLSGRVNVNYHWIKDLGISHFYSVVISLLCVCLVSAALFRSWTAGLLATLPVICSILTVYAAMALLGINLGIGTSMFASVAIGLGIDFAIHTLERLKALVADGLKNRELFTELFRSTGRALLFNYLAIAFGFGVLISSQVVPLTHFGTIVVLSVSMSFVAAMTLLPVLVILLQPAFIFAGRQGSAPEAAEKAAPAANSLILLLASGLLSAVLVAAALHSQPLMAAESTKNETLAALSAGEIAQRVNAVDDGQQVSSKLSMLLTDSRGKERRRETRSYRKYFGADKKTVFFYQSPANVKDTAFLTFDYAAAEQEDDQWLYLPALRKVRRISASDRGDYFMGTDFTYEDIKQNGHISPDDYQLQRLPDDDGKLVVKATPKTAAVAQELGYGEVTFYIDPQNWIVVKSDYLDIKQMPLKTISVTDIRQVDGIWTRHQLLAENHLSGHRSLFIFSAVDYQQQVADHLFTQNTLRRGL